MTAQTPTEAYEKVPHEGSGGKRKCSPGVVGKSLIGFGVFLVIIGILYGTVLPKIIDNKVQSGVVTCNLEDAKKEAYTDPYGDCEDCSPYYYALRMYNVTNAEDHLNSNAKLKLKLKEVGPWVYRRRQIRGDISFENERVTYTQYTYHTYVPEKSCAGCSDQDSVIGYDVGYLNVIAQAGGERAFLTRLALGSFAEGMNASAVNTMIGTNADQMMKWVNGLNSYDPVALKLVSSRVLQFLVGGPTAIADLKLEGFSYNGIFVSRTISQWALGYSSMLAGLGLGSNYRKVCVGGKMNDKCAACVGNESTPECLAILNECKKCKTGAKVVAINPVSCGRILSVYEAAHGEAAMKTFNSSTCGMCSTLGLCAAPLPGIIEKSGLDYSTTPPVAAALNKYVARTGCDDKNFINEYEQFDGYKTTALWATLDKRRNPTLNEIIAFQSYANCISPPSNVSCSVVRGNDATSVRPGGVSMSGFESELDVTTNNIYLLQANQNVTLYNTQTEVDFEDITLHRFQPANDLLVSSSINVQFGTGFPVDGVQPLGFSTNFLAYVSYPLFLWGDKSLLEGVELTMENGVVASNAVMYDNGVLKKEYADKYATYIDVEAGTGKTMRARKRLQASYALSASVADETVAMSDVLWPKLPVEVIVPAYFGEEFAEAAPKRVSYYKKVRTILGSLVPVLIVGVVVGVALAGYGFFYHRKHASAGKSAAGDA